MRLTILGLLFALGVFGGAMLVQAEEPVLRAFACIPYMTAGWATRHLLLIWNLRAMKTEFGLGFDRSL